MLAFQGVEDGLCDMCDTDDLEEPTNADAKEGIEHVEKHKESVEIGPGIFLDQKEARGYLVSIMIGRGLLPSAQLAHGIGVLVADAVRGGRRKKRSGTRKRQRERPHGKAWPLVQTVRARRSERPLPTWFGRA